MSSSSLPGASRLKWAAGATLVLATFASLGGRFSGLPLGSRVWNRSGERLQRDAGVMWKPVCVVGCRAIPKMMPPGRCSEVCSSNRVAWRMP